MMEEEETDWADEEIDSSRAFAAVCNVLMLRLIRSTLVSARWRPFRVGSEEVCVAVAGAP